MVLALKTHKVKKNQTLEQVAKIYKIRKWEDIWKDKNNKKIAGKRKLPRNIEPGDILVIPFDDKEKQELFAQRASLHLHKLNEHRIEKTLLAHADNMDKCAKTFLKYRKETDASYKRLMLEWSNGHKKIVKVGAQVDLAKEVLTLGVKVTKLGKLAHKSTTATGAELTAINKEALKISGGMAIDGANKISSEAKKAVGKYLKKAVPLTIENALKELDVIKHSWENIQKPSFVALTVVSLWEGKGWSEAVTRDLKEEVDQRIARLDVQRIKEIAKLSRIQTKCEADAKEFRSAAKAAVTRGVVAEKMLKTLPEL